MAQSLFERNPKKTILALLFFIIFAIIYVAEKVLEYKHGRVGFTYNLPNRAIRLREYRPSMVEYLLAGEKEKNYDTLASKKYLLRIDDNGFIYPSEKYPDPDISLVFLGASTTECRFVEEEKRFPYATGTLLEKDLGIRINSYNAGRSGNHTLHSLNILLNKIWPLNPHVVVMMHNINDMVILLYEKTYWNQNSSRSIIFDVNDEIVSNFTKIMRDRWFPQVFYQLRQFDRNIRSIWKRDDAVRSNVGDEFAHARGKQLKIDQEEMTRQFEINLQAFIDLCKARNIIPVLMTMASRLKENPDKIISDGINATSCKYKQFKDLFDAFNESIRKKARENQILLIDLAKEIPPEKEYFYDVVHHNDYGSLETAKIISSKLSPLVKQLSKNKK